MLSHSERLHKCIAGEKIDRPPVALWRHFPIEDLNPALLAKAVVNFQNTYDFDFVKITPSSSFCVKDWGSIDKWHGNPEGSCEYIDYPITTPEDWKKINELDPHKGHLAEQLECIKLIKNNLPKNTPVIQTIFNPLSQVKNLVGKNNLLKYIRLYPDLVKEGLRVISNTTEKFIRVALTFGIDGIFYAVQHAQAELLSQSEFDEFSTPYDLQILKSTEETWLNVAHIHGANIYFEKIAKFPVQVLNWHDLETPPSLSEGQSLFTGAVCGGLRQWETLVNGTPALVNQEALASINSCESSRFILGTGCVLPITAPHSNILAARTSVDRH